MRFSALHKLASYLMVASAFAALGLSGELPPPVLAVMILGGAASWLAEPSRVALLRARSWSTIWNVATLAVFAGCIGLYARGEPFLIAGVHFLCFLAINKLWNRRASKDWLQLYVISFLMLVAGTTINTDLVYAACFLAYVVFATWTLTLFHLRREMEENYLLKHTGGEASERVEVERILNSRRVVGGGFLAGTSLVSASIFLASSVFFFLFPRIGFNVFASRARHGLTVGFNDRGVELGQNGLIKDNDQVVMRVELEGGTPPERPLYLRGISFDRYERGRWFPSTAVRLPLRRFGPRALVGTHPRSPAPAAKLQAKFARALKQEIYLEPMDTAALFAASTPFAVELPPPRPEAPLQSLTVVGGWIGREPAGRNATGNVSLVGRQGGVRYTAWSLVGLPASGRELDAIPDVQPGDAEGLEPYLDASGVTPRERALALEITRGAVGPYRKAKAIQQWLRDHLRYSLLQQHASGREPVEEFLFERRAGHCEYFASAMALLLRAVGVPTRHVAGFYGGEWNTVGRYLQVRQRDAHAWVEAWLEGAGWVSFDPTPPSTDEGPPGALDRLRQLFDVVQMSWFKYVIEYDLGTQVDLFSRLRRWLGHSLTLGSLQRRGGPWMLLVDHWRAVLGAGAGLLLVGLAIAWARARRTPLPIGFPRRRMARAQRAMERALRALERRGFARSPSETHEELAARAARDGDPGAPAFRALVERWYAARFGAITVDADEIERLASAVARPPASRAPVGEPNV